MAALALASVGPLTGCYAGQTLVTAPTAGMRVEVDLNDRGRVAYGERIGQSAARIEGTVEAVSDSAYTVRVANVRYLNGQSDAWGSEKLTVSREYVTRVRERRFSRSRTALLAGGIAAAVIGFVTSLVLSGGASGELPDRPPPAGGT